jgi:small subunit ribosomal protein S21
LLLALVLAFPDFPIWRACTRCCPGGGLGRTARSGKRVRHESPAARMPLTCTRRIGDNPVTCYEICVLHTPHRNGGVDRLAEVRLQDGESLENALRRFKRKVQQEDIIKEIKKHSFYLKPGEKRRVKAALARKRARKKARHEQD